MTNMRYSKKDPDGTVFYLDPDTIEEKNVSPYAISTFIGNDDNDYELETSVTFDRENESFQLIVSEEFLGYESSPRYISPVDMVDVLYDSYKKRVPFYRHDLLKDFYEEVTNSFSVHVLKKGSLINDQGYSFPGFIYNQNNLIVATFGSFITEDDFVTIHDIYSPLNIMSAKGLYAVLNIGDDKAIHFAFEEDSLSKDDVSYDFYTSIVHKDSITIVEEMDNFDIPRIDSDADLEDIIKIHLNRIMKEKDNKESKHRSPTSRFDFLFK